MNSNTPGGRFRLLWVDDEIDLLQPHILYLRRRGYEVEAVHSGEDALYFLSKERFDLMLLDERMPGLDGLAVLERLRSIHPDLPVVMVTKQEDEGLMEEALGSTITDFLTKPVNPSQVLSACKRILERGRLREEVLTRDYTHEFSRLTNRLAAGHMTPAEWCDLAGALAYWSIQLDKTCQEGLAESLATLQQEADGVFSRQVIDDYPGWVTDNRSWQQRLLEGLEEAGGSGSGSEHETGSRLPSLPVCGDTRPLFVSDLLGTAVLPLLAVTGKAVLVVLDCLRMDQWLALESLFGERVRVESMPVFSLIPSASPYSRNALLSGRFADEIASACPDLWKKGRPLAEGEWMEDEEGLNRYEPDMLAEALNTASDVTGGMELALFERVRSPGDAEGIDRRLSSGVPKGLSVVVVNFLDLLVHDQTESAVIQELAPDPAAFRTLARQWFEHSPLFGMLMRIISGGAPVLLVTDHGSIQVKRGVEVKADRTASHGLRYKVGRNLNSDARWTHRIDDMAAWRLPQHGLTSTYMIAREDAFLIFTIDSAAHRRRFSGSFQHGGVSLSEIIVPLVRLTSL